MGATTTLTSRTMTTPTVANAAFARWRTLGVDDRGLSERGFDAAIGCPIDRLTGLA